MRWGWRMRAREPTRAMTTWEVAKLTLLALCWDNEGGEKSPGRLFVRDSRSPLADRVRSAQDRLTRLDTGRRTSCPGRLVPLSGAQG